MSVQTGPTYISRLPRGEFLGSLNANGFPHK
jgi:hypothetical protein